MRVKRIANVRDGSWLRENAGIEFCERRFRLDFNQFEKQKRWRRLPGQYNRENNSARFSCAHVFTQPGSIATKIDHSDHFRLSPKSGSTADIAVGPVGANKRH
jgi:hypothetical protein